MRLSVSISGLKPAQKKLLKKADLDGIRKVVRTNTAELTANAQRNAPVSTEATVPHGPHGVLKGSINAEITEDGMAGVVKTGVDYAEYVELGTRFMDAQPYMKPAFEKQKPVFLRDIKKEISK